MLYNYSPFNYFWGFWRFWPILIFLFILKVIVIIILVLVLLNYVKKKTLANEKELNKFYESEKGKMSKMQNKKKYEIQVEIIKLTTKRNTKIIWGAINIVIFWWLFLIPLVIGIMQLLEVPGINAQIEIQKLKLASDNEE